jgi:hypothetical protein
MLTLDFVYQTNGLWLVKQVLLIRPEHLRFLVGFVILVLCICFVDRHLSFCTFYFGHCVVCSSSIYGFWLPLWYLQTLLITYYCTTLNNTTGTASGAGTAYLFEAPGFTPFFCGVRVVRSFALCIWPLWCLSFFDLRILNAPFVSSNSSWIYNNWFY